MSLPGAATMLFHVGFGFIGGLWSSDNPSRPFETDLHVVILAGMANKLRCER